MQGGGAQTVTTNDFGPNSDPNGGPLAGSLEDEEAQMRPLEERT